MKGSYLIVLAIIAIVLVAGCAEGKEPKMEKKMAEKDTSIEQTEGAQKAAQEKQFGKDVPDAPFGELRNLSMPEAPKLE